jgi:selenocysteine lyase/cysteine desulfurase
MNRRQFLIRTGLTISAALLDPSRFAQGTAGASQHSTRPDTWEVVRDQFLLRRDRIHMTGFLLAAHPTPVRQAIETHRRQLDEDPVTYWIENEERLEAAVLRAAADYLGVQPTDIALTDSTTMGLGLLYGGLTLTPGQEVLTTVHDHYSTEISLRHRTERTGATVRQIPLYRSLATVSRDEIVETLVRAVRPQTRVVAVTWVHSSTGLKLPIRDMADALAQINASRKDSERIVFCVDGVHALGVEDIDLGEVGCDFFIAGTHKWLFGPRGTGLVWGHPRAWPIANPIIPTFNVDIYKMWMQVVPPHAAPKAAYMTPGGFHSFEHRWALAEAFRFHQAIGKERVAERIHALNRQLKEGLAAMSHVTLRTPYADDLSAGITCFEIAGKKADAAVEWLRRQRIIASVTPYATQYVRLAPSLLTSPEEVETTLRELRRMSG